MKGIGDVLSEPAIAVLLIRDTIVILGLWKSFVKEFIEKPNPEADPYVPALSVKPDIARRLLEARFVTKL